MPHTRKEILDLGREIADKVFHKKDDKEEVLLRGYLTRDSDGALFFSRKPASEKKSFSWKTSPGTIELPQDIFPSVKWEDDIPAEMTITIKLK